MTCVLVAQPGEELEGFGDFLFGGVHRPAACCTWCAAGTDPEQMMPSGELFDGLADGRVGDRSELCLKPPLEQGEMVVAVGEETVVVKQAAEMFDPFVCRFGIECLVGEWNLAVGEVLEEELHLV